MSAGALGRDEGTVEQAQPPPSTEKSSCDGGVADGTGGRGGVPPSGVAVAGPHVFVVGLQTGADDGQLELSVHWTHCFVDGLQTGIDPGQSAFVVQVATQVPEVLLQTGVAAGQFESSVHWTQR